MIKFISMKEAAKQTGFSKEYLKKAHKAHPQAEIIVRSPTGGPAFNIEAWNNLILTGTGKQQAAAGRSPAPLA